MKDKGSWGGWERGKDEGNGGRWGMSRSDVLKEICVRTIIKTPLDFITICITPNITNTVFPPVGGDRTCRMNTPLPSLF